MNDVGPALRRLWLIASTGGLVIVLALVAGTTFGSSAIAHRGNPQELAVVIAGGSLFFGVISLQIDDPVADAKYRDFTRLGYRWLVMPHHGEVIVGQSQLTLSLMWSVPFFAFAPARAIARQIRVRSRLRHNRCLACGYDLTGNTSGVCSECGMAKPPPAIV